MDFNITPTISAGQILLIITFIGTALGTAIPIFFKLKGLWLTEQMNMESRLKAHQEELTRQQTERLEECIHKIMGHPENPLTRPPVNPPIE